MKSIFSAGLISLLMLLLAACGGGGDSASVARVQVTPIFSSSALSVNSNRLDWSPDGQWIGFETSDMNVYKVQGVAGSTPVKVTNYDTVTWDNGGEAVSWLADGRLGYYVGWFYVADEKNMHVMAASASQVNNVPAPALLQTFNGDNVGLVHNAAASPESLSLSGDGTRAIVSWSSGSYTLNWSGGSLVSTPVAGTATDGAISRDGQTIAYCKPEGTVVIRPFNGGLETVAGFGTYPSWTLAGKLGYVAASGYAVYTPSTGLVKRYQIPLGVNLQNAAISWDGTKIAFRTFSGPQVGISVGNLVD